jgi:hypothetical protein
VRYSFRCEFQSRAANEFDFTSNTAKTANWTLDSSRNSGIASDRAISKPSSDSSVQVISSSPSAPATYRLNDTAHIGYWSYRASEAHWARSIGSEYLRETPDAVFLIVDITVRNDDSSASTLPPIKLVDAAGREYEETSKAALTKGFFGPLKSINPGVTSEGKVAFDVPQGKYSLLLSGGFNSGETAKVSLE